MSHPKFTITKETITLIWEGKLYNVQNGNPNYAGLEKALKAKNWDDVPKHLTVPAAMKTWSSDLFTITDNTVKYKDEQLPEQITSRVLQMITNGDNPDSILRFWERLQKNPSYRSVQQLWGFLQHEGLPLTKDGCFLAYKGVKSDYKDAHSGTFDNSPGKVLRIPRNQVSDDPRTPCHEGFHVGALSYARTFVDHGRIVVVRVDPEHVVCVPHDESQRKMRVCEYKVMGNYGTQLPDTYFEEETPEPKIEPGEVLEVPVKPVVVKKDPKEKAKDAPLKGVEAGVKKVMPKAFIKIHAMDEATLFSQSLDDLRQYATHGLFIVGASKIPGGKIALVRRIIKTR